MPRDSTASAAPRALYTATCRFTPDCATDRNLGATKGNTHANVLDFFHGNPANSPGAWRYANRTTVTVTGASEPVCSAETSAGGVFQEGGHLGGALGSSCLLVIARLR